MVFSVSGRRFLAASVLVGTMLAVAGCQSGGPIGALKLGGGGNPASGQVTVEELRAFCPQVVVRPDMAYFSVYQGNNRDDRSRLVYQASITDVTRSCTYGPGTIQMNIAVAGRIVPGPAGSAGAIRMPISVTAVRGSETLFSQVFNHEVQVSDTAGATQFIFNQQSISLPESTSRNMAVFVGYEQKQN